MTLSDIQIELDEIKEELKELRKDHEELKRLIAEFFDSLEDVDDDTDDD